MDKQQQNAKHIYLFCGLQQPMNDFSDGRPAVCFIHIVLSRRMIDASCNQWDIKSKFVSFYAPKYLFLAIYTHKVSLNGEIRSWEGHL